MRTLRLIFMFLMVTSLSFAQLIVKDQDSEPNTLLEVNDEGEGGSILLPPLSSIVTSNNKMYNISGTLHWNGTELATGSTFSLPYSGSWSIIGTGAVFQVTNTGENGTAGKFINSNPSNLVGHALHIETQGAASAVYVDVANSSVADAIHATTGTGGGAALSGVSSGNNAGKFESNGEANYTPSISVSANHRGNAGFFSIYNQNNDNIALEATTSGPGTATHFSLWNENSNQNSFYFFTKGLGDGIHLELDNQTNNRHALFVATNGTGPAARFEVTNPSTNEAAIQVITNGSEQAGIFEIQNASNSRASLQASTNGLGSAASFSASNSSNTSNVIYAETQGDGKVIEGIGNGNSVVAKFVSQKITNTYPTLRIENEGLGRAAFFEINNVNNNEISLYAKTDGLGNAASFENTNSSNASSVLNLNHSGIGDAIVVNHSGATGNLALFTNNALNVARIDKTGKGFFNGGTQSSGADIAEAFDVEGNIAEYESGDVLVISTKSNRRIEKSSDVYSNLVIGVYATKPGVLLTEKHIDESLEETVPVGIVGVIPTKVCNENGAIFRGDMLVSASKPGYAMKGTEKDKMLGAVIGKALEPFNENDEGIIEVLVNCK